MTDDSVDGTARHDTPTDNKSRQDWPWQFLAVRICQQQHCARAKGMWKHGKSEGNRLFGQGRFSAASEAYSNSLRLMPAAEQGHDRAALHSNQSACMMKMGRVNEAIEHAKLAISLQPKWAKAHYRLANAYASVVAKRTAACESLMQCLRLADTFCLSAYRINISCDRALEALATGLRFWESDTFVGQLAKVLSTPAACIAVASAENSSQSLQTAVNNLRSQHAAIGFVYLRPGTYLGAVQLDLRDTTTLLGDSSGPVTISLTAKDAECQTDEDWYKQLQHTVTAMSKRVVLRHIQLTTTLPYPGPSAPPAFCEAHEAMAHTISGLYALPSTQVTLHDCTVTSSNGGGPCVCLLPGARLTAHHTGLQGGRHGVTVSAGASANLQHVTVQGAAKSGVELLEPRSMMHAEDSKFLECGLAGVAAGEGTRSISLARCTIQGCGQGQSADTDAPRQDSSHASMESDSVMRCGIIVRGVDSVVMHRCELEGNGATGVYVQGVRAALICHSILEASCLLSPWLDLGK